MKRRWVFAIGGLIFFAAVGGLSILVPENLPQPYNGKIYCEYTGGDADPYEDEYPPFSCSIRLEQVGNASNGADGARRYQNKGVVQVFWAGIGRFLIRLFEDPIAAFTAVLTASTVLLWVETKRGAAIAERALVSAERAFVFQHALEITAVLDSAGNVIAWMVIPGWKNSGSTPARHVVCHVNTYSQRGFRRLPDAFDFPEQWDAEEPQVFMVSIPPEGQLGDAPKRIPIADLVACVQKQNRVFMYGWVEYDDIFPETPRHRTEFCVEITVRSDPRSDPSRVPTASRASPFLFSFQGRHNGAEEECHVQPLPPEQRLAELREARRRALAPQAGDMVRPEHEEFLPPGNE